MAGCFIDKNVLLYAVSTSDANANKANIARELLQTADWSWSAQVAAEFIRAGTSRKQTQPLSLSEARRWVETWMAFPMVVIDGSLVVEATRISERFQISHFDAQIIAAAKRLGCATIHSEDLNHGQDYGGVKVLNPFRA